MTSVKVCGLTRIEDACLAWKLGATALGFIFHPASPRSVTVRQAQRIRSELPPEALCVGVFVDRTALEMNEIAEVVGLSALQLHGRESPDLLCDLRWPVIKAIRAGEATPLEEFQVAAFLLEASHPTLRGGTGLLADWDLARQMAQRHRLILAGGLHPGNVQKAQRAVKPFALDLNSGLESSPGRKDPERLKELFRCMPLKGARPCLF